MEIADFKVLHAQVWAVRQEIEGRWASPEPSDSLRFAVTEIAEAMDVVLRQNPVYTRNHHKAPELSQELSQVGIMLLTLLGEGFDWDQDRLVKAWSWFSTSYQTAKGNGYQGGQVDWIAALVSDALQEQLWRDAKAEHQIPLPEEFIAIQALVELGQVEGVDLMREVYRELERIKRKFSRQPASGLRKDGESS